MLSIKVTTTFLDETIFKNSIISIIIILILIIILMIYINKILMKKELDKSIIKNDKPLTDKAILKLNPTLNISKIETKTLELYKKLETAKTKQKITTLKEDLTKDLYLELEKTITTLKEKEQKLVATNINLEKFAVLSIEKENDISLIEVYLHVSQYDYTINKKKVVIRGTSDIEYQIEYKITLEYNNEIFKIKNIKCIGKWIRN